jgi:diguanylate cyclase (GGDEF)-like protein/PAS domain S-box-containing protein
MPGGGALRGNLFDLALLFVLILFFGLLQAQRPQRGHRMWLGAWAMVLISFLAYASNQSSEGLRLLQECVRVDFLICGGVMFLSSFVRRKSPFRRKIFHLACLAVPPCLMLNLMAAGVGGPLLYSGIIMVAELMVLWLAERHLDNRLERNLIRCQCAVGTVTLLAAIWTHQSSLPLTIILVHIFSACAILLLAGQAQIRVGSWTAASGFMGWAMMYLLYELEFENPLLMHVWNLPKYLVGFGMILTVMEEDTNKITELSEEYRLLYESNPHPMWIFEPIVGQFLTVNDAAVKAYGYTRDEFLKMTLFDIHVPEEHPPLARELKLLQPQKQTWRHRRKNDELFDVEVSGHSVSFQGKPAWFGMAMDITEREKLNSELVYRAQHDALTGLANRILLEERSLQTFARSVRDGSRTAILTIDVDRFKQINDAYGHPVGDECLIGIAARLGTRIRDADTLARTGGEEFTALIGGLASIRGAQAAAAALLSTLVAPLTLKTNEIMVSVSIGIAVYPDHGSDLETILKRSDQALYQAKRMGGGRALLASAEQDMEAQSAIDIEAALRDALHAEELELAYQPIFGATGKLVRVEALVRGTEECLRKAGPGGFIPVAEESGLILPLGRWVVDEACRQLAEWRKAGIPLFEISVNVSARQVVQNNFAEQVLQTLDRYQIPAKLLHLELTETTLMREFSAMVKSMQQLSDAGVLFSIDDFGTGYSSLARLSELPISTIKIDRSFVVKLLESDAAVGIVRAIVHMSRHLRLEVVAEGVEQPGHIAILLDLGCHMFQGYYLSRPLSAQALAEALTAGTLGFRPDSLQNVTENSLAASNFLM